MRRIAILPVLFLSAGFAFADEVQLKTGGKVTGIATESGDRIVVEVASGTISFHKDDVLTVTKGRTTLHEYRERAEEIRGSKNASDHFDLHVFAKKNGMSRQSAEHLQQALRLDPNHEGARRASGYQLYQGRWMTEAEIWREKGFVLHEGKWMTSAEIELERKHKLDLQERRLAMDERKRQREEEERERRLRMQQEYYEKMLELERERERNRREEEERRRSRGWYRYYEPQTCYGGQVNLSLLDWLALRASQRVFVHYLQWP